MLAAKDGEEAVRLFAEHGGAIHLAILDVMMPRLGGREAMEQIQSMNPRMRFLFSSGYSDSAIHTDYVVNEGLRLIAKPYRKHILLHAVREVLDSPLRH